MYLQADPHPEGPASGSPRTLPDLQGCAPLAGLSLPKEPLQHLPGAQPPSLQRLPGPGEHLSLVASLGPVGQVPWALLPAPCSQQPQSGPAARPTQGSRPLPPAPLLRLGGQRVGGVLANELNKDEWSVPHQDVHIRVLCVRRGNKPPDSGALWRVFYPKLVITPHPHPETHITHTAHTTHTHPWGCSSPPASALHFLSSGQRGRAAERLCLTRWRSILKRNQMFCKKLWPKAK